MFGATSRYQNDYRWQRQPSEAMSVGRNFRFGKENRFVFQVRAEFQNVFNRLFYGAPTGTNPAANTTSNGSTNNAFTSNALTAGFGYVNTVNGAGARPRAGTLVGRITF